MKQKKSVEDYLKTIYVLSRKKDAHGVHPTEKGMRIAEETYERHNTFCQLLTGLGVDEKTAASDACEMEHAVSAESYRALKMLVAEGDGGI